jgi:DNA-directed RNA polymerase subunit RPC12/RpoP
MEIELICQECGCRLVAPAETPEDEIVQRMTDEGPWYGLSCGDRFRDMVATALRKRGRIRCPECGESLLVQACGAEASGLFAWRGD